VEVDTKKLLLLLVPLALLAQVDVDTVIRLPREVGGGCFFPELNKLYVDDYPTGYFVLDCSTYQLRPDVPGVNLFHYSWNWRRQKLYVTKNPRPDSTLVIDVAGDSVLGWLEVCREWHSDVYLSDIDVRFKPAVDTLYEFECAADTVIRRLPIHSTCASWDSVGRKLYVGQGSLKKLYVYDYLNDSCLKVIDVSAIPATKPDACVFSRTHRRAYVSSEQWETSYARVGIVDTEQDTLLRVLPVRVTRGLYKQVVVDELDGKVYMTDCDGLPETPDTMWVVDCASDSVLKKFECVPEGHTSKCIRWVPWSNRIYLLNDYPDRTHNGSLVVIDCNTDSVIVPGMLLGGFLYDIQLDPIRQRIFVTGDTDKVYVLRDVEGGVAEEPASARPALAPGLQVQMTSGGYEVSYSIASPCGVDLSIHDLMGREVRQLVAEQQPAGEHCVNWDCRDTNGTLVPRGVYFLRLDTPGFTDVKKAVVTR
jgi:DNA-binding beta-propeller fold protein YncE